MYSASFICPASGHMVTAEYANGRLVVTVPDESAVEYPDMTPEHYPAWREDTQNWTDLYNGRKFDCADDAARALEGAGVYYADLW